MTGAELDTALHGVAIYNPDLLSRDALKRYFVGRRPLLERILAELKRERPEAIPQHRLILGQRGMGKTSLLRRLAVAVDEDPQLAEIWLPLTFPEEQYNVADLADLWLNCLDALGDALERAGDTDRAEALDTLIESLADADAETVLRALLDQARGLDRRLLLLLDNADLILQRLRNEHWALRETLQSEPGYWSSPPAPAPSRPPTSTMRPSTTSSASTASKGLPEDELRATLIRLRRARKHPAVTDLVHQDPARIRTLHLLTGGNPRTTVLRYGVLAQGPSGDVRSDLESLLDRVTPLYKARFEELPEQASAWWTHWPCTGTRPPPEPWRTGSAGRSIWSLPSSNVCKTRGRGKNRPLPRQTHPVPVGRTLLQHLVSHARKPPSAPSSDLAGALPAHVLQRG